MTKVKYIIVFACMIATLLSINILANAATYSGDCGTSSKWVLYENTGELTISGTGKVTSVPWANNKSAIKYVVVEDGITSLPVSAFSYSTNLISAKIGNGVTSIGNYAFAGCSKLDDIQLGSSVTKIGVSAFDNCISIESIVIPDGVKTFDAGAFGYCEKLKTIKFGNGLTSIGNYAFSGCIALETAELPSNVTVIGNYAFSGCKNLKTVQLNNKISLIGSNAFEYCSSMNGINIPSSVTSIGDMAFNACKALESINVDGSNVSYKDIDGVLYTKSGDALIRYPAAKEQKLFEVPDAVESIETWAFYQATSLESIAVGSRLKAIGYAAFYEDDSLKKIIYKGTQNEFNAISVGDSNAPWNDAEVVFDFDCLVGDTDCDGMVTLKDVTYLRRYIAGGYGVIAVKKAFDVDNNGEINLKDVTLLRRYVVGGYGVVLN